ncbi:DUF5996 family protein [Brevundimonas lenta]|uniref:Catechol 2,3-dioxygenase-like lactoylglutathione lyase family enzyme n=1 Tax=Brevundimonas lenta TaxID=424796 RepID=A0A7W6J9W2_9CAUL|nr:DUF5996 family protein [Brevundimonas lenta]MBB4081209.1 catechol 2,3-dioxygenase-like lactoylglutathione lyase family enzyme [Brevundimonas lenta]
MTASVDDPWPALPYGDWAETGRTLHLWTQIVGKVRLAQTPWLNHSWQAPLYLTPRGLTTGPVFHGLRAFELEFDFIDQALRLRSDGPVGEIGLVPMPVAQFYARVMTLLNEAGLSVAIHGLPNEIPDAVPFTKDTAPRVYDPVQARRFWRALLQADRVMRTFRTAFLGKASPVHFFWGSFDLAVTRFSGRPAPPHPGGVPNLPDAVTREAYSHEVSSAGFWPGGPGIEEAVFYSYAYPEPPHFREAKAEPEAARFEAALGEFVLPYEAVRTAPDPDAALMAFLQSTYRAAADAGRWDPALECGIGVPGRPRPA